MDLKLSLTMSKTVPKHYLFAFGHNPFQKLGPAPSPTSELPRDQSVSSILSTPTDVLPHLTLSCDHIIRSSLRSSGSSESSVINGDVEIKAEFIWSCYSSSLVKVRWFLSTDGRKDSEDFVAGRTMMGFGQTGEFLYPAFRGLDKTVGLPGNEQLNHSASFCPLH